MGKSYSTLIAIGGGEISESPEIMEEIRRVQRRVSNPRMVVLTIATNRPEEAKEKYSKVFRGADFKHVDFIDVSLREDAFNEKSIDKVRQADILFFTGGDQLNITSLMGGSPLHDLVHQRHDEGIVIAGSSAGAAMMSSSMITTGESNAAPMVSGVKIAPGMNLIDGTIIDTHFSQRGRYGRLLTAVAHYPQAIGIGIDEKTAIIKKNGHMKIVGNGVITIIDGSQMRHSDLAYKRDHQPVGLFGVCVHTLPSGYKYDIKAREPEPSTMKKMAGVAGDL